MVNKINTYYCNLNLPEDFVEYESLSFLLILYLFMRANIICKSFVTNVTILVQDILF